MTYTEQERAERLRLAGECHERSQQALREYRERGPVSEGSLDMIRAGYTERTRCLGFRVMLYRKRGIDAALHAIGRYNDFDPERVLRQLSHADDMIDHIEVGRESSPVLYLHLTRAPDAEGIVAAAMRDAGADEVTIERESNTLRAWWD